MELDDHSATADVPQHHDLNSLLNNSVSPPAELGTQSRVMELKDRSATAELPQYLDLNSMLRYALHSIEHFFMQPRTA